MSCAEYVARMEEIRNMCKMLVGKPAGPIEIEGAVILK